MQLAHVTENFTPAEIHDLLTRRAIVLVDVREPAEYAGERIHGTLNYPLSTFDPTALPIDEHRPLVLQCGSGKRSAAAMAACDAAGVGVAGHLAGGIQAWRAAGFPTARIDPATGAVIDPR